MKKTLNNIAILILSILLPVSLAGLIMIALCSYWCDHCVHQSNLTEHTYIICKWCFEMAKNDSTRIKVYNKTGIKIPYGCWNARTCELCAKAYLKYHNLTFDQFPYHCWKNETLCPPYLCELCNCTHSTNKN